MRLRELIQVLSKVDPDRVLKNGFGGPHSYRGYYSDLGFNPQTNVRVGDMLDEAQNAIGKIFIGYKGGEFKMEEYTECWIAKWGNTGETIGPILLGYMLANAEDK